MNQNYVSQQSVTSVGHTCHTFPAYKKNKLTTYYQRKKEMQIIIMRNLTLSYLNKHSGSQPVLLLRKEGSYL